MEALRELSKSFRETCGFHHFLLQFFDFLVTNLILGESDLDRTFNALWI